MQAHNIHLLPNAVLPMPAAVRHNPHVTPFRALAVQLGINGKTSAYQVGYVRALIEQQNFPEPLPRYIHSRHIHITGAAAVAPAAQWQKAAVDAWFDGRLPPDARTAAIAESEGAASLDDRAANLDALIRARRA